MVARVGNNIVVAGGACHFEDDPLAVEIEIKYKTKKNSCTMYSFDCKMMNWEAPYDLRREESVFFSVTGMMRDRLVVVGIVGDAVNVKAVSIWEVRKELGFEMVELCVMPKEMVEKLRGRGCEWRSVRNKVVDDGVWMGRVVLCGDDVGFGDLNNALLRKCKFELKHV
ncbi:unnamed protein product [Vicia faba]|uniref:Uncharacterized protein n=1 Tax=Vicia faba TaxID=3906 RepID=A0AAV0YGW9_VICFA|nr:unnamed protein product [Vicia faba]